MTKLLNKSIKVFFLILMIVIMYATIIIDILERGRLNVRDVKK